MVCKTLSGKMASRFQMLPFTVLALKLGSKALILACSSEYLNPLGDCSSNSESLFFDSLGYFVWLHNNHSGSFSVSRPSRFCFNVVLHIDWRAASLAWSLLQTASNSVGSFSFSIRKSAHAACVAIVIVSLVVDAKNFRVRFLREYCLPLAGRITL